MRSLLLLATMAIGAALLAGGCREQKPAKLPPNAVALVGDQVITREALQNELTRRGRVAPDRYADPMARQFLLEELIQVEALHQKALAAGYDQNPEIVSSLKRMIVSKYQEDQLARLGSPKVTAEEIEEYYRRHPDRFGTPEKVRVAIIQIKVPRTALPDKRAEVAKRVDTIFAEAASSDRTDDTFEYLAQKYSEDQASRYRGGDVGWMVVGDTNAPWDEAVLRTISQLSEPGELAPVIETPTAFYLVKLSERQPASMRPLAEVQDGIAYLVAREKEREQQEELYARAIQGLPICINDAVLETISLPANAMQPAAMPGVVAAQVGRGP